VNSLVRAITGLFERRQKMYRIVKLLGLLVAIMSVNAFGVGFIGTPTAELEQGQWNVGFNYMYSDMDLSKTKMTGSLKELDDSVTTGSFNIDIGDVKTQRYYGTIGYGLTNVWEAYVQLGIADLKIKTRDADEPDEWSGLNFDNDFAWGWGTRYTFYEQGNARWGASVQMNWLDTSLDTSYVDDGCVEEEQIDFSTYDLIVAVGPTVDMGGWNLYGGPFYYMIDGDLDIDGTCVEDIGTEVWKYSGDLEEDSNIGGFVGVQCTVMEQYDVTTELCFSGDGWAIGAGVCCAF
jgi:hypothetical protein